MDVLYRGYKLVSCGNFALATHNNWPCVSVPVREMGSPVSGTAYWKIPKTRLQAAEEEGLYPDDLLELCLPADGREPDSVTLKTYTRK